MASSCLIAAPRRSAFTAIRAGRFASGPWNGYVGAVRRGPAGASVSEIFREIDEELRRDNLLKLWSRYRRYIVALAVLVLVVAGGIVAWRDHQLAERRAQSMRYSSALSLVREGKDADAARVFAAVAEEGGGYATLARFEEAELLAKSGDHKGAAAAYDHIAAAGGIDPVFRDLATLLSIMQATSSQGTSGQDVQSVIARLEPMTSPGRDPRQPVRDAEGATSPEPLRPKDRDETGSSGIADPR